MGLVLIVPGLCLAAEVREMLLPELAAPSAFSRGSQGTDSRLTPIDPQARGILYP